MTRDLLEADLRRGADALGLALTSDQVARLLDYLDLLQKWGRVYNLTALRDPQSMLSHHLLDSLAILPPLDRELRRRGKGQGARLLDVGSGAGLPGVVIAICRPGVAVHCVDAVAKKTAFVRQVAASLGLANLGATHARVEELVGAYDIVCSRAFASLADFVAASAHLLAHAARADIARPGAQGESLGTHQGPADGCWLAMKGQPPDAEIADLPSSVRVFHVEQLTVPTLDAQRCIVWMERQPAA